jgi:hypothetical protein
MPPLPRRTLCLLLLLLAASDARAQTWTFRPVFSLSAGYNSNILYTPGDVSPADYFGGLGMRAPITAKLSQRSTLLAGYGITGVFYKDRTQLDKFPNTQNAWLRWNYASPRSHFALGAYYNESRRPEDVFPETGLGYLRGKTTQAGANASFDHRLGERGQLSLGYGYTRPFYETGLDYQQQAQGNFATAGLSRVLNDRSQVSVRYQYQLYVQTAVPRNQWQTVGLAFTRGFGRGTNLSLFGGAQFAGGEVRPTADVSLGHAWRSSLLSVVYRKGRNYIPTTGGFSETDWAGISYLVTPKRFRLSLSAGYARNNYAEPVGPALGQTQDFDSFQGTVDTVYMLGRRLGLGGTYSYVWQRSGNTNFDDRRRHVALVGLVITPWNPPGGAVPALTVPRGLE